MIEGLLGLLIIIIGVYLAHFIPNYVVYKKLIKIFNYDSIAPYTLPKMSFEQIHSLLSVPELNIRHVTVQEDCDWGGYYERKHGMFITYTWNGDSCEMIDWLNNERNIRNLYKPIFIVPKSSMDYLKLRNYFNETDKASNDDSVRSAQIESLKYITDLIHQSQDNHAKILQDCQSEMDRFLDGKDFKWETQYVNQK